MPCISDKWSKAKLSVLVGVTPQALRNQVSQKTE
nr:MAG TPA: hypothetical protein [Caudoviricetes sp.]